MHRGYYENNPFIFKTLFNYKKILKIKGLSSSMANINI